MEWTKQIKANHSKAFIFLCFFKKLFETIRSLLGLKSDLYFYMKWTTWFKILKMKIWYEKGFHDFNFVLKWFYWLILLTVSFIGTKFPRKIICAWINFGMKEFLEIKTECLFKWYT